MSGFQGVSDAAAVAAFPDQSAQTPDVDLAVGPNQIVQTANSAITVWDRSGHQLGPIVSLDNFFSWSLPRYNQPIGRAPVVYDAASQHFFMAAAVPLPPVGTTGGQPAVWLAVSQTSDPSGNWWVAALATPAGSAPAGFLPPEISVSMDKIAVLVYPQIIPPGQPLNEAAVLLDKAQVLSSGGSGWQTADANLYSDYGLSLAQNASPTSALYFVAVQNLIDSHGQCAWEVRIQEIDGPALGRHPLLIGFTPSVEVGSPACDQPPLIPQPGSTTELRTLGGINGPFVATHAVWQNGELYVSSAVTCGSVPAELSCLLFTEADTDLMYPETGVGYMASIIGLTELGSNGSSWWAPSMVLDARGNLFFASYVAGATGAPELVASGSEVGASSADPSVVLATSDQTPDIGGGYLPYGVTTASVLDPTDPTKMWVSGEYYTTGSQTNPYALPWTTAIEEVQLPTNQTTLTDNFQHLYTLDGWGGVHADVASPPLSCHGAYWPGWDIARGLAVSADGTGGYLLDGWGGLHPCGNAPAVTDGPYWPGWDIARAVALRPDGRSGYVLDGWGGLHPFGGAPAVGASAFWQGWDIARSLVLTPDGGGGYVLDGWGGLHPFGDAPTLQTSAYWAHWDIFRALALTDDGTGGYVLDAFGGVHPFGSAPYLPTPVQFGFDAARGLVLWNATSTASPGGWVLDAYGGLWPFGYAPPIKTGAYWAGWDITRSLSGAGDPGGYRR